MTNQIFAKKGIGISFLIVSIFITLVNLMIGPSINMITGILLLFVSIGYLKSPLVEYDAEEIRLKNMFGSTLRRANFHKEKVEVRDGAIYRDGNIFRIGAYSLNTEQVQKLHKFIQEKEYLFLPEKESKPQN